MVKAIAGSIVVVLLVSSGAMAQIDLQYQGWDFSLGNAISMDGGPGSADTTQGIGTISVQNLGINPTLEGEPTVGAAQGFGVALFQTGGVETGGAEITLGQDVSAEGVGLTVNGTPFPAGQTQQIGDLAGPTTQYEGVLVEGSQDLEKKVGSNAGAEGLNIAAFGMGQTAGNNCAQGCQGSIIIGGSYSQLEGAAQSEGTVGTTMSAQVQQFQAANGEPAPVQP